MKVLRILTGVHAGAQLQLSASAYRVGPDRHADIRISDWPEPDATLSVGSHGEVSLTYSTASVLCATGDEHGKETHTSDEEVVLLPDYVPFKQGEIVICVGDDQQEWPSDIELLRQLWHGSPQAIQARSSRRRQLIGYALSIVLLVSLASGIVLLMGTQNGEAAQARNGRLLAKKVNEALVNAKITGLHVTSRGAVVVVSGMVATSADDAAARSIFNRLAKHTGNIERRYDVAANISQEIEDAIGIRGVHAQYLGDGAFKVMGAVDDLARARDAMARLGPDFDSNVKRIEDQLTQSPGATAGTHYSELISNGSVKYLQTPDGVKHLYMNSDN